MHIWMVVERHLPLVYVIANKGRKLLKLKFNLSSLGIFLILWPLVLFWIFVFYKLIELEGYGIIAFLLLVFTSLIVGAKLLQKE